jgi:phage FluMu protein Com
LVAEKGVIMTYEAQFSVNCPRCDDVELAVDQLWLVLPSEGQAHYDFHCPECETHVRHPAGAEAIAMLSQLVAVEELEVPAEALESHTGPALTEDDLIDLMLELDELVEEASASNHA